MFQLRLAKEKVINFVRAKRRYGLSEEAYYAYFHKLPAEIHVEWIRDGKMIVGKIKADGDEFMTQGETAEEFVDMVNDAIFSAYDIPIEYFRPLESKKFRPTKEQFKQLDNIANKESRMSWQKDLVTT